MPLLQIIENPEKQHWETLLGRPVINSENLETSVRKILEDVKKTGDKAVMEYSVLFDQITSIDLIVREKEFDEAENKLGEELKAAIHQAEKNISIFHSNQQKQEPVVETLPGISCWRKSVAIEKIGLYIPGGTAPLFSTLLMLGIPARIAGCKEIIICTPPQKDGTIHPAVLYVAKLLGISKLFRVGGVQAIAAMAYGTNTIPQVYKIFGPGNQWVTQAKKLIQQEGIAIDMPAGPSELAIFADETAIPAFVAADLLSQCEHGADSQVILVTDSRTFAEKVNLELEIQIQKLPRKSIVEKSLENSKMFLISNIADSMDLLNMYAPEHLILACRDAEMLADKVRNAGSVFLGNYAPESAGDYATGTNHTLPTNGFARAYSGISIDSFVKKISFQKLTKEGLQSIGNTIIEMARAEGFQAHAEAIVIRLLKPKA
ncbi:MAG TPA: histidinol dehydrogenase [Puia sp.]|jgi:histidinol dehydrogenase|nr:histidinol dehydrogenase [Puia sp.]